MTQESTSPEQSLYHVRIIDGWRSAPSSEVAGTSGNVQKEYSFFGLGLNLHGRSEGGVEQTIALSFFPQRSQRGDLSDLHAPFTLLVAGKMPLEVAMEPQKTLLHHFATVQVGNRLERINKIHFLKHCHTGFEVYTQLERVLDHVSVARPFELAFHRHNHSAATAKILPFAGRADVQRAQVAQFEKLQVEERKWSEERKRRKQFLLQQMDFQREHYLYHHVGLQLHELHEEIMAGGQWQAYEFDKALWYYHAPRNLLFAEHPMRNNEKTRQLIGSAQLRTRFAAQTLQHGVRRYLWQSRVITRVLDSITDAMALNIWCEGFEEQWTVLLGPFFRNRMRRDIAIDDLADELWRSWVNREAIDDVDEVQKDPILLLNKSVELLLPNIELASSSQLEMPLESITSSTLMNENKRNYENCAPTTQAKESEDTLIEEDDDDNETNWRRHLRLLKTHHKCLSPSKAQSEHLPLRGTSVVPPGSASTFEPALQDRSEDFNLLQLDGPSKQTTLKVTRSVPMATGPRIKNLHAELGGTWARRGSFRSFHAFFTGDHDVNQAAGTPMPVMQLPPPLERTLRVETDGGHDYASQGSRQRESYILPSPILSPNMVRQTKNKDSTNRRGPQDNRRAIISKGADGIEYDDVDPTSLTYNIELPVSLAGGKPLASRKSPESPPRETKRLPYIRPRKPA